MAARNRRPPESALAGYLDDAQKLADVLRATYTANAFQAKLAADAEVLRWFDLPAECIAG